VFLDGRYLLESIVARGAMGAVYLAEQYPLRRKVAVKVMDPQHLTESLDKFEERFLREAAALARLQHPNIVRVYDYGRYEGLPYLVMEFIDGYSLQRLQAGGPIPPARVVHIATQICDALEEAHALDLIHRDLKPANVLLTRHAGVLDVVKVVDFGLAKDLVGVDPEITDVGQVMGTPMYMAPEQIRDDACDARTDIYALGMLLYRSLTGKLPFQSAQTTAVLLANLQEQPPPFQHIAPNVRVSAELERVVLQCLEKDPDRRFPNVRVLRDTLRRFDHDGEPSSVVPRLVGGGFPVEDSGPRIPTAEVSLVVRSQATRAVRPMAPRPVSWVARAPAWAWVAAGSALLAVGLLMGIALGAVLRGA
jgi:serine/threonine protein kinase